MQQLVNVFILFFLNCGNSPLIFLKLQTLVTVSSLFPLLIMRYFG
uniref:Uncharacterized protein n=1 Tax=Anguilla anguilla TaxID=7936 RepID=A0A0E9PGY8_ANGAN